MIVETIDRGLAGTGLFVRGGFHPSAPDGVPPLADGRAAGTMLLIGNAGNELWRAFRRETPNPQGRNPLDDWVDRHLDRVAAEVGAEVVYPTRKPWPPIQRWALQCEPVHRSPLGLLIHAEYGLWHVYRGAFLFAGRLDLPHPPMAQPHLCDACERKPCLTTCPVTAFKPGSFDSGACVEHVESREGRACASGGCLARRACPVGRNFAYEKAPGAFHMAAVVSAVRRMQAKRGA